MSEGSHQRKEVYVITEREVGKPLWTRVGVGFVNRDQSINVMLESIPLNGKLHIRDPQPRERKGTGQ